MHRAFPLTIRITTGDASFGLRLSFRQLKRVIDFEKLMTTRLDGALVWSSAIPVDEFELVAYLDGTHPTTFKGTGAAGDSILACFGLTSLKLNL
jgi:hypothetical protein